ncbi:hypothetical protein pb186bvf_008198 [Paramecium bursaria]
MYKYLLICYPLIYINWCNNLKIMWLDNNFIDLHENYILPYKNRFKLNNLKQELDELDYYNPDNYNARLKRLHKQ